jgi:hypothetical protein
VGAASNGTADQTLLLRWDGRSWRRVPSPDVLVSSDLLGVAASSASNAWAVGIYHGDGGAHAFAIHCC